MKLPLDADKGARILIVDDERLSAQYLARILEMAGYPICITLTDPTQVVERFAQINPDLMLLDLHMEPLNGLEVLRRISRIIPPELRPPIVVVTGDTTAEAKHEALQAGATDFLSKPLDCVEVQLRIKHLLHSRRLFQQCQIYSYQLEGLVEQRTAQLQKQTHDLELAIDELKETQQQIIQQERLRALGTMASGIAHDLNNGLSLILGYGDLLLEDEVRFPKGSQEHRFLDQIVRAGRDNATLVKRLRNFYRPRATKEDRQLVDLNELTRQAIALTEPRWGAVAEAGGATVRIETEFTEIPQIAGSPAELREVLTNVIFNAVDAMPSGGRIRFRTRREADRVLLQVSDNGMGMTAETKQRCLEPFYTTKGESGSGLGLAMSYGILRRHGGSITIESKLRKGTTFTFALPIARAETPLTTNRTEDPLRRLRILIVDDHPGIREIVSSYLAVDGHIVEAAASGREALDRFCNAEFDLVITDRAMPDINGHALAAAIKRIKPRKPIIMLTGFADMVLAPDEVTSNVDLMLTKPARLDDLRDAIRKVMPEPAPQAGASPFVSSTEKSFFFCTSNNDAAAPIASPRRLASHSAQSHK